MRRTLKDFLPVVGGAAILALTTLGAGPLAAQYFGQNKVQYRTFDFKIIQTEHFEVYYYPEERAAALDAARMAERGYARLSRILHHQFQGRKPIVLYASGSDFQQTNVTDVGGESVGGVTEFFKHRMVLPFTGSYAELEHVLQHEMVHQFQFDVYSRGRPGGGVQTLISVNPPLWFMEGMADHLMVALAPRGVAPHHVEGLALGRWVLLDYVDFVVHVFHPELRDFYQLERLWGDAPVVAAGDSGPQGAKG